MENFAIHPVTDHELGDNNPIWKGENLFSSLPTTFYVTTALAVIIVLFAWVKRPPKPVPLPWVNKAGAFDLFSFRAKYKFLMGAKDLVLQGFRAHGGPGFRMVADSGEVVMLAPKYAAELKTDHRVDFVKLFLQVFHTQSSRIKWNTNY